MSDAEIPRTQHSDYPPGSPEQSATARADGILMKLAAILKTEHDDVNYMLLVRVPIENGSARSCTALGSTIGPLELQQLMKELLDEELASRANRKLQ